MTNNLRMHFVEYILAALRSSTLKGNLFWIHIHILKAKLFEVPIFYGYHCHVYLQVVNRQGHFGCGVLSRLCNVLNFSKKNDMA